MVTIINYIHSLTRLPNPLDDDTHTPHSRWTRKSTVYRMSQVYICHTCHYSFS